MSPDASWTTRAHRRGRAAIWLLALGAVACLAGSGDLLEERREQIRQMTPHQQAQLRENQRRFAQLDDEAQERLGQIHDELERDPRAAELRQVMRRYCQWLSSQPMTTQYELTELPAKERLARIKELRDEEHDERGLREWLRNYIPRMFDRLPAEHWEQVRKVPEPRRRPEAMRVLFETLRTTDGRSQPLEKALADLRNRVSPDRGKWLAGQPLQEQLEWVFRQRQGQRQERFWQQMLAGVLGGPPEVRDSQLAEVFTEQSPAMRDQLMGLPSEEMYDKLRGMYHAREWIRHPRGQMPPGPPDGRPGPPEGRFGPRDADSSPPAFLRGPQPGPPREDPRPSPPRP